MRDYVSLTDRNYLPKLVAMHGSLLKHSSEEFRLHVLCLDDATFYLLYELQLENVERIYYPEFERGMHLAPIKASRTYQEFCWSCSSQACEWVMPWTEDGICYVDADVFFYSDPKVIFDEVGEKSIGVVPHRFNAKDHARLAKNGLFNVGIMVFRQTDAGRKCLTKWADNVRGWCQNAHEGGKFADQAYLDHFELDYPGEVRVIENLGVNLGPWSIGNFAITERSGQVHVNEDALCAFHFHEYRDPQHLTGWPLRPEDKRLVYAPYIEAWKTANARISEVEERLNANRAAELAVTR